MDDPVNEVTTLEEKLAFLRSLEEAYYSGVTRVRFRERDVTYRSLDEMEKVITRLKDAIAGRPRRRRVILTSFSRGRGR